MEMHSVSGSKKISWLVEKTLLATVERLDMEREHVIFADVCDSNKELFGHKGTTARKNLQEHWKNLKRRSIRSWALLLTRNGVPHSDTTKRLLEEAARIPSPETIVTNETQEEELIARPEESSVHEKEPVQETAATATPEISDEPAANETSVEPTAAMDVDDLVQTFQDGLQLNFTPPRQQANPFAAHSNKSDHVSTPTPKRLFAATTETRPDSIATPKPLFSTNSPFYSPQTRMNNNNNNNENTMWQGGSAPSVPTSVSTGSENSNHQSRNNPRDIHVDLQYPERNYPFDIVYVPRIEHGGWAREGVDIRQQVGIGDADFHTAWMDNSIPGLENRVVMVRARSRSSAFDALESYHRNDPDSDTAAVHQKTVEDIQEDPDRQAMYWRLIFNKEMTLDNVIISGDSVQIKKNEIGTIHMAGPNRDIECKSYFVSWVIAKRDAGHALSSQKKKSLNDAFL